jgi:hypothetical protein
LNGGRPGMTAGQFADIWRNKFAQATGAPLGDGGNLLDTSPARPLPPGFDPNSLVDASPSRVPMQPADPFSMLEPLGLKKKKRQQEQAAAEAAEQQRRQALFGDPGAGVQDDLSSLYG